jgi:hypothetical protein
MSSGLDPPASPMVQWPVDNKVSLLSMFTIPKPRHRANLAFSLLFCAGQFASIELRNDLSIKDIVGVINTIRVTFLTTMNADRAYCTVFNNVAY